MNEIFHTTDELSAPAPQETLVLLDSPGLFAPNRAAIFDSQLLAVLNLLSSVVMYNSMNIMDRSAIERLSYAIETGTGCEGATVRERRL
jgi:hypothetical protein